MNYGKIYLLLLLDLSAAFVALDWFQSYLSDRTSRTRVDNVTSDTSQLMFGLPQGSVLGPILFSMYMLPTADTIMKHGINYHCYADDTQIYLSVEPTLPKVNVNVLTSYDVELPEAE